MSTPNIEYITNTDNESLKKYIDELSKRGIHFQRYYGEKPKVGDLLLFSESNISTVIEKGWKHKTGLVSEVMFNINSRRKPESLYYSDYSVYKIKIIDNTRPAGRERFSYYFYRLVS